jgi:hypothetical protein
MSRSFFVSFVLALFPAVAACSTCKVEPHCEGDVQVRCSDGGHWGGSEVVRSPCTGMNPVCAVGGPNFDTFCVRGSRPTCTPTPVSMRPATRCEGQVELTCWQGQTEEGGPGGYEVAIDCNIVHEPGKPPGNYECKTSDRGGQCQPR